MTRMQWTTGGAMIGALGLAVIGATLIAKGSLGSTAEAGPLDPPDRNCWDRSTWGPAPTEDTMVPIPVEHPGCLELEADLGAPKIEPTDDGVGPRFVGNDLSSNRGNRLAPGTLQVVVFYDGDESAGPTLRIGYRTSSGEDGWIDVRGIHCSTSNSGRIDTFEYDLRRCALNGRFEVDGIRPNGVIDGLAFGLVWRDERGFHSLRSTSPQPRRRSCFVGSWPLALNDRMFALRTPQLREGQGRLQAKMALYGAEYLDNGRYLFAIQERAVRLRD